MEAFQVVAKMEGSTLEPKLQQDLRLDENETKQKTIRKGCRMCMCLSFAKLPIIPSDDSFAHRCFRGETKLHPCRTPWTKLKLWEVRVIWLHRSGRIGHRTELSRVSVMEQLRFTRWWRRGQPRLFSGRWSRRVNPSTIFTTSDLTLYFLTATGVSSLWTFYMESSARDCVGPVSSLRDIFVEISLMMENFGLCSQPMQCIRACYHRYHRSLSF